MNNNITRNTLIAIIAGVLLLLSSCGPPKQEPAEEESIPAVPVRVAEIQPQTLELTVNTSGVIRSRYEVSLMTEIGGTILKKAKEIGDAVSAGDAIVLIDPEPYDLALAQAKAGFDAARASHDQAKRDYTRAQELRSSEDISQYELENAELVERTALANLEMAEANVKLAKRNVRLTHISSPIEGVVADVDVTIGQQISPGMLLGMVVSLDHLEIEAGVSERDIVNVKQGNRVDISTDAYPGKQFIGFVRAVGVAGLDLGKSFPIIVSVDNKSGLLRPGMIVRMNVVTLFRDEVLAIPRESLALDRVNPTIFVVEDNIAFERQINLGPGNGTTVVVESGISTGARLVVEGQNSLSDSVRVKVL
jgi:RND family efflux transporter MFP subunit